MKSVLLPVNKHLMDKLQRLQELLKQKKSKKFYSERLGITIQEVEELLEELRGEEVKENFSEATDFEKGSKIITYKSDKPLTPQELEKLAGVDGINTYVARTWLKSSDKGIWNYSIDVRFRINDFYSGKELQNRLKDIFPKNIQKFTPKVNNSSDKVLMLYIGDDHCGMVLQDSQYGNEHSEEIYQTRLENIYQNILDLSYKFDKIYIVSLGDELDGNNGYTTRGGHSLGSKSNKEQFDIYVESRRKFYDKLFTSELSNTYIIVNQNNSNHSGLGFSYMANRALEMYLEQRFSNVFVLQTNKIIQTIEIGNHVFGFVHGKDDKHQKNPMPLNLDAKTDAYLFEFYDKQGYSPSRNWISTVKADIHKHNVNMGKHGRYVNVPSISSGSNWIEANFGNSKPGALIELVNPHSENIISIPIWF